MPESSLAELAQRCLEQPTDVGHLSRLASALGRAGQHAAAVARYQQALALAPQSAELWFNLGNAQSRQGETLAAKTSYRRALQLNAHLTPAVFNLANLLRDAGGGEEAMTLFRQATEQEPKMARAWSCLGNLLRDNGQTADAITAHQTALGIEADNADHHYNLANALRDDGQSQAALEAYRLALQLEPGHFRAALNLALLQLQEGMTELALAQFKSLTTKATQDVEALSLAAVTMHPLGLVDEAIQLMQKLLFLQPDHARTHMNLGAAYGRLRNFDKAIPHLRRAIELEPDNTDVQNNLARALVQVGHVGEAIDLARELRQRDADNAAHWALESQALMQQARVAEATASMETALALEPENSTWISQRLFTSLYDERLTAAEVTALHRDLAARLMPSENRAGLRSRPKRRRGVLHLGYLSQDLLAHPVGYFLEPLLEQHDATRVKTFCYSDRDSDDETARALRRHAHAWRDCVADSDDELLAKMQEDELDVLIDLGGHSAGGRRMRLLGRRPAPVQILYLGYPNSSGLPAVDYVLADEQVCPPEHAHLLIEQALYPSRCFLCFKPPPDAPAVAELPYRRNGYISFGCYNHSPKLSTLTVELWARVIQAVDNSRLVLKAAPFADALTRQLTIDRFVAAGVAPDRIRCLPPTSPLSRHLQDFSQIDIALDPTPFNGGTTTCQTLWMGVPVISLAGDSFQGRMGLSVLSAIDCEEWVAHSPQQYVELCAQLAGDVEKLAAWRCGLRERMLASSLCDAPGFTRRLEDALLRLSAVNQN